MSVSDMYRQLAESRDPDALVRAATPVKRRADCRLKAAFAPPSTPVEMQLAAIWTELLAVDRVGTNDNFFELSGDSLLMTQALGRIHAQFGIDVPVETFFAGPTIAQLAVAISAAPHAEAAEVDLPELLEALEQMSDEQIQELLQDDPPAAGDAKRFHAD